MRFILGFLVVWGALAWIGLAFLAMATPYAQAGEWLDAFAFAYGSVETWVAWGIFIFFPACLLYWRACRTRVDQGA